jgi:hypothetical protein
MRAAIPSQLKEALKSAIIDHSLNLAIAFIQSSIKIKIKFVGEKASIITTSSTSIVIYIFSSEKTNEYNIIYSGIINAKKAA